MTQIYNLSTILIPVFAKDFDNIMEQYFLHLKKKKMPLVFHVENLII